MKRVITYGTFDLLHYGHINLLRRAKQYGDYLIVALSTDEFNWEEKRKKCCLLYTSRTALQKEGSGRREMSLAATETGEASKIS